MRILLVVLAALALAGCKGSGSSGGNPACDDAARKAPRCGGIAALKCPAGLTCVDDPCDSCDPAHGGADCGGICLQR